MNFATIIFVATSLSASLPALADPDRLSILFGSRHPGAQFAYEQTNPGVFLTWEDRALGLDYSVGAFRNSYGRASVAATAALPVIEQGAFQASLFGGLALYPGNGDDFALHLGDIVPIGGIQARLGHGFVQVMPGDGMAVVTFGMTFALH